ncbi:unnamed protein product [Vitrella brassicaformis CCMP3155]|uniref:Uncharacterized protein n=2 Tax=Vitrella brassicaformis TaxID=1169539 RepID=A0A0G4GLN9_VITBC|nr:unnamed protein product [Vitrella brassicaformis CCMP3155]|eukprot:CEM31034.1 unnamed protein product [Vitrella brassicaformis CCMP3155]
MSVSWLLVLVTVLSYLCYRYRHLLSRLATTLFGEQHAPQQLTDEEILKEFGEQGRKAKKKTKRAARTKNVAPPDATGHPADGQHHENSTVPAAAAPADAAAAAAHPGRLPQDAGAEQDDGDADDHGHESVSDNDELTAAASTRNPYYIPDDETPLEQMRRLGGRLRAAEEAEWETAPGRGRGRGESSGLTERQRKNKLKAEKRKQEKEAKEAVQAERLRQHKLRLQQVRAEEQAKTRQAGVRPPMSSVWTDR